MCLAAVYQGTENSEPAMKEIARLRIEGDSVELETLFGEKMVLQGRIKEIDFMGSRVVIE